LAEQDIPWFKQLACNKAVSADIGKPFSGCPVKGLDNALIGICNIYAIKNLIGGVILK